MTLFLVLMMVVNCTIGSIIFYTLFKKRKLFGDRFGMIMAMCCSGVLSFIIALILHFLFPVTLSYIFLLNAAIGGVIGLLFGALVTYQSVLSGATYGVIGSMMGTMLSAVVQNPALCSLPASYLNSLEQNIVIFTLFGTALVMLTISLVFYSLRV